MQTNFAVPVVSAAFFAVVLGLAPVRADEGLDSVLAKIGRLSNKHDQRMLERLAQEPANEGLYSMCAAAIYNAGRREVAIALLELGVLKAARPERVRATLRAVYRYELDLDRLEKSYAEELDQVIDARHEYLPKAVLRDPVMVERLRPKYLAVYKKMPGYKGLFELVRRMCKDPEQVLRIRLAGVPGDARAAGDLLYLLREKRAWKLLAGAGPGLPAPVREHPHYLYTKAQALLEMGKKDEALAGTDEAAKALASYKWAWEQVGDLYAKLGKPVQALRVARTYAPPGDHKTALALARYGDSEGANTCVQQCIDRGAPAWVLFQCVDACRNAGLNNRAEEVFDLAEDKCLRALARDRLPAFNLPLEIRHRYQKEGRHARLIAKFAQAFAGRDKEIARLLRSLCQNLALSGKRDEAVKLAGKYYRQQPGKPEFMLLYADMLERARKREQAGRVYQQAATMPSDSRGGRTPLDQLQRRHQGSVRAAAAATQRAPAPTATAPRQPQQQEKVSDLAALVEKAPQDGALHVRLGLALIRAGKTEDGRQQVRKGLQLGCDFEILPPFRELPSSLISIRSNLAAYRHVVEAYLSAGLRAELEKDFHALLSRTNAHKVAHLKLVAQYLANHGRPAEAEAIYLKLNYLDPYRGRTWTHTR